MIPLHQLELNLTFREEYFRFTVFMQKKKEKKNTAGCGRKQTAETPFKNIDFSLLHNRCWRLRSDHATTHDAWTAPPVRAPQAASRHGASQHGPQCTARGGGEVGGGGGRARHHPQLSSGSGCGSGSLWTGRKQTSGGHGVIANPLHQRAPLSLHSFHSLCFIFLGQMSGGTAGGTGPELLIKQTIRRLRWVV